MQESRRRWAIVLAGGEGERLRSFTIDYFGRHKPKQYCEFEGLPSLLQQAIERVRGVVPSERFLTIIGKGHRAFLTEHPSLPGQVIEQPENLDTGPGILLPLTHVLAEDPKATVLILPSDHFIAPAPLFRDYLETGARAIKDYPDKIVLFGAVPDAPEPDYGWIEAGPDESFRDSGVRPVLGFYEKPSPERAEKFYRQEFLWNTMVMAVKAETLWSLADSYFPEATRRLEMLKRVLRLNNRGLLAPDAESVALNHLYRGLTSFNFSSEILQKSSEHTLVLPMEGIEWSDWGRPDRVLKGLQTAVLEDIRTDEPYSTIETCQKTNAKTKKQPPRCTGTCMPSMR